MSLLSHHSVELLHYFSEGLLITCVLKIETEVMTVERVDRVKVPAQVTVVFEVQRDFILEGRVTLVSVAVCCKNLDCGKRDLLYFTLAGQVQVALNLSVHPLRLASLVLYRLCHIDAN